MKRFLKNRTVKLIRHTFISLSLLLLLSVFIVMPYSLALRVGGILGRAACFLLPAYRRKADINIRTSLKGLSPTMLRKIRIETFRNIGMNLAEFGMLGFRPKSFWMRKVEITGIPVLKEYIGRKGIIYLTAHIGNWELMGAYLSMAGYPVNVVAKEIHNSRVNHMLVRMRKNRGVSTVYRDGRGNVRKMVGILRKKEMLGILIDQDTRVGGIFVDFFGRPAYTPTACSQFARLKDTVVIPGFIYRKPGLSHRIEVMDPVPGGRDIESETQGYTRIIESFIKRHPSQWVWMHSRWKKKPA